jgi:two-component system, probable response regulator PhcQ
MNRQPETMEPHRILLIDDEAAIVNALTRELRRGAGSPPAWRIEAFTDPAAALARARECRFALAISDYRMPSMTGVALLTELRALQPDCMRMILSGQTDREGLLGAINEAQIARFVAKPWIEDELVALVHRLLAAHERLAETEELADRQRLTLGQVSPQEAERLRLERLEPGLTRVDWDSDGSYVLDAPAARPVSAA